MEDKYEIGFLTEYYEFMCEYHGEINYGEYGTYIFSLFFLRYIYCKFQELYLEIIEDGCGLEEYSYVYIDADVVYVPPEARWDYIVKNRESKEIGYIIEYAMKAVESENESLNKLTKELEFKYRFYNMNMISNIRDIIYLIDNDKTNDDGYWLEVLKRIYMDMVYFGKSTNYVILNDIIYDLEYYY